MSKFRRIPGLALGVSAVAIAAAALAPAAAANAAPAAASKYVADPASLVDPIIGTSGAVDDFPGADVPFGMVQWSPDTPSRPAGGGYEYNDTTSTGFSLTHISGPGCAASGDVPILPTSGALPADPGSATIPLDHKTETAQAGYYKLAGGGITSELTSTTRTGAGRFTFPKGQQANLVLKLSDSAAGSSNTRFQVVGPKEIQGSVTSGNFCGATDKYTLFFDMVFDQPITGYGTYQNSAVSAGTKQSDVTRNLAPTTRGAQPGQRQDTSSNGVRRETPDVTGKVPGSAASPQARTQSKAAEPPVLGSDGAYVSFDTSKSATVQTNVGISYVSNANAKQNRTHENGTFAFDALKAKAHDAWTTILDKIRIGGGDTTAQTTFYTAMYHALLHPNVFSDANGQYAGFDGQTHRVAKGHLEYANYSGWDIYRSQVQLAAMVAPQQTSDSVRSMLNQYDQTGQLPKWALNNGESYVMVGDPADPIIADAYAFGARDFDHAKALAAMEREANEPNNVRPALSDYLDKGYIPLDVSDAGCCNFYGAVSTQQEYNTADHAIASFATALGDTDTANTYRTRANNWQNVFNPASGYLQPKNANGVFTAGFSPTSSQGFVEGSAAQYTPMQPFDIAGSAAADGGRAAWIAKLDALTAKIKNPTAANADFGNEPSIEIPWEYDYVGAPWKTQSTVRSIQQQIFTNQPAGIAGNDDLGTMSAWYVWSALGFYPETPGTTDMAIGSPVFANAQVSLPSGKTLTITAPQASTANPYVQSMTSNGASWSHAYLQPGLVTNGGSVGFTLGSTANTSWAAAAGDAPPSDTAGLASALGYTTDSVVVTQPGKPATVTLGARNLGAKQTVQWAAGSASSGVSAAAPSGSLVLPKGGDRTTSVAITAPKTEGRYTQTFTFRDAAGRQLPSVTVEVDVAQQGALWPFYNDAGIANDGQSSSASFDGEGWSYSAQALAAAGVTPGKQVVSDGLTYTFPDTQPGEPDNIQTGGQTIPLAGTAGATRLGILGSATNGDPDSTGTFTVTYTDGSTQQVTLGFSDWTLNAGSSKPTSYEQVVADTPYRDTSNGGRDTVDAYLFTSSAALTAGKTVASVTLPETTTAGPVHVFAFAIG